MLLTLNKVVTIIGDEYKQCKFYNIFLAYWSIENNHN